MIVNIIGVKRGKNKAGEDATNLYYSKGFSQYDAAHAECIGQQTESVYTTLYVPKVVQGDKLDLIYEPGFEGKATLVGVNAVK